MQQDEVWSVRIRDRLVKRCGRRVPERDAITLSDMDAPTVVRWFGHHELTVGDLLRNPDDRCRPVPLVTLLIVRGTELILTPEDDTMLIGDQLLLAGNGDGFAELSEALFYSATTEYIATGRVVPSTWLWRVLTERAARAQGVTSRGLATGANDRLTRIFQDLNRRYEMSVAETVAPLVRAALGPQAPIGIRGWDGSRTGPLGAPWQVNIVNRRGLRRLLWAPNELGFARAYVSGDIDIEGDLVAGLDAMEQLADPSHGPGVRVDDEMKRALAKAVLRLGIIGPPPRPPAEEARLIGHRHDKRSDAAAISHHYDVGNDFYRLVLGESMTYSCGYWATPDQELDGSQYAKCDLVARKLGLTPGMRVLDVGCGWGTFALHAARNHGVRVVGVTLSREQAEYASTRMNREGVGEQVQIRVQDYRDVTDGPFDAISSIGMAEHVGVALLPTYAAKLYGLLRPQGRLLNHAISRRPGETAEFSKTSFIDRYVFPDGELEPMATMIDAIEGVGFEVRDVESLREHYALTLRAWVRNLEDNWDAVVAHSSAGRARVWRLFMAGSALAFTANRLGINQILAVKSDTRGRSGLPATRADLLTPRAT